MVGFAIAMAVSIAAGGGCSLLVNHESAQCASSDDCAHFGNQSVCTDGICVAPVTDGGKGPITDSSLFSDVLTPPCQTSQDCLPLHGGANWICRKSDGTCVEVDSPDCPAPIIGNYTSDDVILLGALLPLPGDQVYGKMGAAITNALRLAVDDFSGNLPAVTDGGNTRPVAVVLCSETVNADRAARHLRDDLHVPLVFGTAFSASTITVAEDVTRKGQELLFSPAAGSDLSAVNDGGLVWRTIPSDSYQAAAIDATVSFVEANGFPSDAGAADAGTPLRVAIVHQADVYGNGLAALVAQNLTVNGGPASDAGADFIDVDYGNPDQPTANQNQLYADAINAVQQQLPNVIVLLGYTHAIGSVLSGIENVWPNGTPLPRYVLSNGLNTADLLTAVGTNDGLRKRILVTSPGQSASNSVTSSFYIRYRNQFTNDGTYPQSYATPNMYDAFYAAAYALAATRNTDLVGLDVATALRKVLGVPDGGTATSINVGSDAIPTAFATIQAGAPIALHGVSGPLSFDLVKGDVVSDVQIWCLARGATAPTLLASGLVYSASLGQLQGSALAPGCN